MKFQTEPYKHQREVLDKSIQLPVFAFFWEMGTGKSKIVLDEIGNLFLDGKIDSAVIISDKSSYENWAKNEIPKHLLSEIKRRIFTYRSGGGVKYTKSLRSFVSEPLEGVLDFFLVNIESFSSNQKSLHELTKFLSHRGNCYAVIDEATSIKNPAAQRTKNVMKIQELTSYRRIATGTPITKGPLDFYSPLAFLDKGICGYTSYYAFRNRYAVLEKSYVGSRSFEQVVGYQNLPELKAKLAPWVSRITKAECLDLPPKTFLEREVQLTDEQRKHYNDMVSQFRVELEGKTVTVNVVIDQILKLKQILSGFIQQDGQILEIKSGRLHELLRVVEELGNQQVVIWSCFRHDVHQITKALQPYGSAISYMGGTLDPMESVARFQNGDAQFFVGTLSFGSKSITLTNSSDTIYFQNDYNLEDRLQSEDRIHRIGQTKPCMYLDLIAKGTVDEMVLANLKGKKALSQEILGDIKEALWKPI